MSSTKAIDTAEPIPTPDEHGDATRELIENAPLGLAFVDAALRYVVPNESIASSQDMPLAAHVGLRVQDVVPELWGTLGPIFDRVLAGETVRNIDLAGTGLSNFYPVLKAKRVIGIEVMTDAAGDSRQVESATHSRNHLYAMLAKTNQAMSKSASREELFQKVCEIAVKEGHFKFAWVGMARDDSLAIVATAGEDGGYFAEQLKRNSAAPIEADSEWAQGPTGQAFLSGETAVFNEIATQVDSPRLKAAVDQLEIGSGASFPIKQGEDVVAVLTLYAAEPDLFADGVLETLNEISPLLSHAMDRFALEGQITAHGNNLLMRDRALRAATQGAVVVDAAASGQPIIYATPAFEQLTGYSTEEIVGKNCRILQGPDTDPAAVELMREALAAGEACSLEILNYRKNGETFWNDLTLTPLFGDDGVLTHFIGVQTDVTGRHTLERQVRQAQKMEAVGQLAGGVAHDFNNLLTVIRGEASLALSDELSPAVQQHLQQVDTAARHAAELTHQLLAFSRQQVLKPEATDLNKVVDRSIGLVARLIGDNIELREELGPELEAILVDPGQLQQVIINLAINARDAMADGGTISVRTSPCLIDDDFVLDEPMPYVLLEITDEGCGMDDETQLKIFDPFFTTKDEGTGLGLATVYGIIRQSGGHISIRSESGVGTTFMVYLPTTQEAIVASHKTPRLPGKLDGTETILHVEDSEMMRPLISRMLGEHGYEILSAANAAEAQEIAATHTGQIDLLLTDIVMPGLNGRELADHLHVDNPDLTVLFTSGYPSDTVVRQGISESEVNFIQKPFIAADLVPLVRSLLDDRAEAA